MREWNGRTIDVIATEGRMIWKDRSHIFNRYVALRSGRELIKEESRPFFDRRREDSQ